MRVYPASALSRNQELWRLWAKGFSLQEIGQALGKPPSSIYIAAVSANGESGTSSGSSENRLLAVMGVDFEAEFRLPALR